jgi:hypothetical protein
MVPPIPVDVRSKTYVCCCSIAGIASSNPNDGMDVRPLRLLRVVNVAVSATGGSLVQRSPTGCACVNKCSNVTKFRFHDF